MQKVAIIGCGGSGKSALARQLGERLHLPVTHLDTHFYDANWNPLPPEAFTTLQENLVAQQRWVIEGNYASTLPVRLNRADTVIFLDVPPLTCLRGVLQRRREHRGDDELSRHLRGRLSWSFIKYILTYRRAMRPKVQHLIHEHTIGTVVTLTSRRAARRYLAAVPAVPTQPADPDRPDAIAGASTSADTGSNPSTDRQERLARPVHLRRRDP